MQQIDESCLDTDLGYRFAYLTGFMGFSTLDIQKLYEMAYLIMDKADALVEAVYKKIFDYDATSKFFVKERSDTDDKVALSFSKQHLKKYLSRLFTASYDERMLEYLDNVGKMHTLEKGKPQINVSLVHMNAMLGFVSDALVNLIATQKPGDVAALRAVNKLLWLQNDLINRHYVR